MQAIIREFNIRDLKRVHEIERKSFKDPYHPLFLLELYDLFPATFLVAEINFRVVGYIIARKVNGKGHIIAIAVDPEYRNQGIGTALMHEIIERLRMRGVRKIWLEVRKSNKRAIKFYKQLGFKIDGISPSYYSDGEDAVILSLIV